MIVKIELVSEVGELLRILEVFLVPDLEYKQRPEGFPVVSFFRQMVVNEPFNICRIKKSLTLYLCLLQGIKHEILEFVS